MNIEIDSKSGFCHGVVHAISKAELVLNAKRHLYCLGDIVHNSLEVSRLQEIGLETIDAEKLNDLKSTTVLLRAHGEPPSTYKKALERGIKIVDATCPVVLRLQQRVNDAYEEMKLCNGQVVIYGKQGHAEVIGLLGQTENTAIVISSENDFYKIDFSRPTILFSQTTQNISKYQNIARKMIAKAVQSNAVCEWHDTICRQVANRDMHLRLFAKYFNVILFVSDPKSSNGAYLYSICKNVNEKSFFISSPNNIHKEWFNQSDTVGICGATSTPTWLMKDVEKELKKLFA